MDCFASNLFLTVYAFKELVDFVFIWLIGENILFTLAEECGRTVIFVMKYDKKENLELSKPSFMEPSWCQYSGTNSVEKANSFAQA